MSASPVQRLLRHAQPRRLSSVAVLLLLSLLENFRSPREDPKTVDVVIPVTEKDFHKLEEVVGSLHFIRGLRIGSVYLVTPVPHTVPPLDVDHNVQVIADDVVLGPLRLPTEIRLGGKDRTGWVFQQLIKLAAPTFTTQSLILWHDADTVFCKPVYLVRRGRAQLFVAREFHKPYQDFIDRLVPGLRPQHLSFVAHSMLVQRDLLEELLRDICRGRDSRAAWPEALIRALDQQQASAMSEYDLYARYALHRRPASCAPAFRLHLNLNGGNPRAKTLQRLLRPSTISNHVRA